MADSKISALTQKDTFGDNDFLAGTQGTGADDNRKYGKAAIQASINGYSVADGLSGLIQNVTATTYNLIIRTPFSGAITAVGGVLSVGNCDIRINVNGTPLGSVTSVSTTYAEQVHAASNTFSVNDVISLVISNTASSPENLDFIIKMTREI